MITRERRGLWQWIVARVEAFESSVALAFAPAHEGLAVSEAVKSPDTRGRRRSAHRPAADCCRAGETRSLVAAHTGRS